MTLFYRLNFPLSTGQTGTVTYSTVGAALSIGKERHGSHKVRTPFALLIYQANRVRHQSDPSIRLR